MNRDLKRCAIAALSITSLGCLFTEIKPRTVAWNQTSQAVLIASQRAASCTPLNYVKANSIPIDYTSKQPFEPGTLVCDWQGRTGQINGYHAIDYVRQGDAQAITKALVDRGFQLPPVRTNP